MNSKWITAALLALVGIVAIVAAILYFTVAAKSLPSVLGTLHHAKGHRSLRGIVALVVGLVLLGAAGWIGYYKPPLAAADGS